MFRFIVWPDQSIMQTPAAQVPRIDMTPVLAGRELANVIRINIENYSLDNPALAVTQAVLSADVKFSPTGHNVIILNNNLNPSYETVLGTNEAEYFTNLRAGFPGWETYRTWWEDMINAIAAAGHRIDALHMDIESVSGWWWSNLPAAKPTTPFNWGPYGTSNKPAIIAAHTADPTGMPAVDYTELAKYAGAVDAGYYAEVTRFNEDILQRHLDQLNSVFTARVKHHNPAAEATNYGFADYTSPYSVEGSAIVQLDLTLDGISSPYLYSGLADAQARLANITGPHIPWLTPTTGSGVTVAEANDFVPIIDAVEAAGHTQALIWGALGDTYPLGPGGLRTILNLNV